MLIGLVGPGFASSRLRYSSDSTTNPKTRRWLRSIVTRTEALVGDELALPSTLHIELRDKASISRLRSMSYQFRDGKHVVVLGARRSNRRTSELATVHELGHSILQNVLIDTAPRYLRLLEEIQAIAENDAFDRMNRKNLAIDEMLDYPTKSKLRKAHLEEALRSKTTAGRQIARRRAMLTIERPFHELFADTTAVLYAKDGAAITKVSGELEGPGAGALRDFSRRFSVRETKLRLESPAYELFAPVRGFIWKIYQRRSGSKVDPRPAMLEALAQHSAAIIDQRLRKGHARLETVSVAGINRALKRALSADSRFMGTAL